MLKALIALSVLIVVATSFHLPLFNLDDQVLPLVPLKVPKLSNMVFPGKSQTMVLKGIASASYTSGNSTDVVKGIIDATVDISAKHKKFIELRHKAVHFFSPNVSASMEQWTNLSPLGDGNKTHYQVDVDIINFHLDNVTDAPCRHYHSVNYPVDPHVNVTITGYVQGTSTKVNGTKVDVWTSTTSTVALDFSSYYQETWYLNKQRQVVRFDSNQTVSGRSYRQETIATAYAVSVSKVNQTAFTVPSNCTG